MSEGGGSMSGAAEDYGNSRLMSEAAEDNGSGGSFQKTSEDGGSTYYNRIFGGWAEVMRISGQVRGGGGLQTSGE